MGFALALAVGGRRRGSHDRPGRGLGLEPPGGAADRGGSVGRPDGSVRVPEPGQAEHGHAARERDSRRGPGRGPELVHVLARRAVQHQDRHGRRCEAERDLPLPVPAEDRAVLPRRHRPAVHGDARSQVARRPSSRRGRRRRTTSARVRPRTTTRSSTKSIASFDGGASKAFAGQRDDPFFGDIGAIFDLVAIRKGTGNAGGGKDFFSGYGVHTIGVQVPIADLQRQERHDRRLGVGRAPEGDDARSEDA